MDRWNIVTTLNYLPAAVEAQIVLAKSGEYDEPGGKEVVDKMIKVAELSRQGFVNGDISVMSPRTVISWAQNAQIFSDVGYAFRRVFPQQVRRSRAAAHCGILPAGVRLRTCPKAWSPGPEGACRYLKGGRCRWQRPIFIHDLQLLAEDEIGCDDARHAIQDQVEVRPTIMPMDRKVVRPRVIRQVAIRYVMERRQVDPVALRTAEVRDPVVQRILDMVARGIGRLGIFPL